MPNNDIQLASAMRKVLNVSAQDGYVFLGAMHITIDTRGVILTEDELHAVADTLDEVSQ